jgi:hypothetical protein
VKFFEKKKNFGFGNFLFGSDTSVLNEEHINFFECF